MSTSFKAPIEGPVGIFVLNPDGPATLEERGWRGEEVFAGRWESPPDEIAAAIGLELDAFLEVHAVIATSARTWIVLRRATRYGDVDG